MMRMTYILLFGLVTLMALPLDAVHAREIDKNLDRPQCSPISFSPLPMTDEQSILDKYNNENRPGLVVKACPCCTPTVADGVLAISGVPTSLAEVTAAFNAAVQAAGQAITQLIADQFSNLLMGMFGQRELDSQDIHDAAATERNSASALNKNIKTVGLDAVNQEITKSMRDQFVVEQKTQLGTESELWDICELSTSRTGGNATFRGARISSGNLVDAFIGQMTNSLRFFGEALDAATEQGALQPLGSRFAALGYERQNPNFTKIQVDTTQGPFGLNPSDPVSEIRRLYGQYQFYCNPGEHEGAAGTSEICPPAGGTFTFNGETVTKPPITYMDNDANFAVAFLGDDRLTFDQDYNFAGNVIDLEEQAAIDFVRNIVDRPLPIVPEDRLENRDTDAIEYMMEKRRLAALRSVPLTTFAELYGRRQEAPVTGYAEHLMAYFENKVFPEGDDGRDETAQQTLDMIKESFGVSESTPLSEAKPSKEAVLNAMSTLKYLSPSYFAELATLDTEEHIGQRLLDTNATESILLYEVLEASLRREALMATMLEVALTDERQRIESLASSLRR